MNLDWTYALLGGAIIGIAVTVMLLFNGRVTGISGIVNGLLTRPADDLLWRLFFVTGLFVGGLIIKWFRPESFGASLGSFDWKTIVAGLLVGFGTVMGSGCTSGHGVCGISRLSVRSIAATLTFIFAGVVMVVILRNLGVVQ